MVVRLRVTVRDRRLDGRICDCSHGDLEERRVAVQADLVLRGEARRSGDRMLGDLSPEARAAGSVLPAQTAWAHVLRRARRLPRLQRTPAHAPLRGRVEAARDALHDAKLGADVPETSTVTGSICSAGTSGASENGPATLSRLRSVQSPPANGRARRRRAAPSARRWLHAYSHSASRRSSVINAPPSSSRSISPSEAPVASHRLTVSSVMAAGSSIRARTLRADRRAGLGASPDRSVSHATLRARRDVTPARAPHPSGRGRVGHRTRPAPKIRARPHDGTQRRLHFPEH